jgi:hypothetical protein
MSAWTTIFVLGFSTPSTICLILGWRAWVKGRSSASEHEWREVLLTIGLILASVCQVLATAFLVNGFRSDRQSFAERVSDLWAVSNWTTTLSWLLVLATVVLGKGRVRLLLLVWALVIPVTSWIVVMTGYDY